MRLFVILSAACLLLPLMRLRAEPLNLPAPLMARQEEESPGSRLLRVQAADRALAAGFPSLAADLYRQLLRDAAPSEQAVLGLSCVSALLADGQLVEARELLDGMVGLRSSAWHLRSGLLQVRARRTDLAKQELALVRPEELPSSERAWFLFLQGAVAVQSGALDQGRDFFSQAVKAAETPLAAARFMLAREEALLRTGATNLEVSRFNAEKFQGQKIGYGHAREYAVGLDIAGRKAEAVAVLQRLLQGLPAYESGEIDHARLLLGFVDGADSGSVGRNALFRLLESGQDEDRQHVALQLLARASTQGLAMDEFRRKLGQLVAQVPAHPMQESFLLYRAEAALAARDYDEANASAKLLLDRYPGSRLALHAHGVLINAAWDSRRFRAAADLAEQARQLAPAGELRERLGLLGAESWYRAGDYRSAASAYAGVLRTPPPGVPVGLLMFQRVQSEIDAGGDFSPAMQLLDELSRDPAFDLNSRWQAEWNLSRALRAAGRIEDAYGRAHALLAAPSAPSDPALRARMTWLLAVLCIESGRPAEALPLADTLAREASALPLELKTEIAGSAPLVRAQAQFALDKAQEALASLQALRSGFPGTDSAAYSVIIEADYYAGRDRPVDAQQRLVSLADEYPESPYAPYALYRAALLAEQRGQDSYFKEANKLIERLVERYPLSDLVFHARLRQGAILVRLNEFALAGRAYEDLVKKYPNHGDVLSARMALADCHAAQAGANAAHADRALELYEGLVSHPAATADMRAEAGYKLGLSYSRRGETSRATEVWWRDVVDKFVAKGAQAQGLGSSGRYWTARTLLDLGDLLERRGRGDEARRAFGLLASSEMTVEYAQLARARLGQNASSK